jgi:hypothetical protein
MVAVSLDTQEWNQVLQILSQAPWAVANPLIMKLGDQLRAAATTRDPDAEAKHYMEAVNEGGKAHSNSGRKIDN